MSFLDDIRGEIRRTTHTASCSACSLLAIILTAACSAGDELPVAADKEICFTTQMTVATRNTLNGTWSDNDTLTICTGGKSRDYAVSPTGVLSPGNGGPLFWHRTDTIHVTAYYSPLHPLNGNFQIEQDQQQTVGDKPTRDLSDVLYSPVTVVNYGDTCRLNFKHLAAYVRLTVAPDSTVTVSNLADSKIRFVNQHIVSGSLKSDGTAEQRETAGDCTIVPYVNSSANNKMKTVEAMLVPQSTYGTPFITLEATIEDGGTKQDVVFTYTPTQDEAINLESGKLYNISMRLTNRNSNSNNLILDKMTINSWNLTTETIIESVEYVE
jgi:hypothetical protein